MNMQNRLKKILLTFLFFSSLLSFSQVRNCGTMEHLEFLKSQDPLLEERMQKNENNLQRWIDNQPESSNPTIITIPVVVHVVYYNSNENISTAQVQSQIDILNEDFRRLNSDASNTPSAFQSVAADCEIEFCLATTDPNGNSTTGITRTSTSQSSFSTNDEVKYSSSGGIDAWNTSEYLNIWVCDISGGILGYAQFPGGNLSSDGVVCDYAYFGNTGTATYPFNLGRTATHEVGHYLNLRHIWGDANCGNDYCNDTPEHSGSNYGCPNYPSTSNCSGNGSYGDMFMNYMDYTDDACMNMFSQDQKTRMIAAINTYRSGLLSSNGCQGSGYGCTNSSAYNYDPNATIDDGSCCYVAGCTDVSACNYNAAACYDDGSCQLPDGCTDPSATNYDPNATCDDGSCCFGGGQLLINITTDNYPSETSWDLVNQSGVVVASINAGDLTSNATNYSWSICVNSNECYDFIIYDTYGDGICCSYGNGSYSISYNGSVVASGGSFSNSETTSSIGSCVTAVVGCMNVNAANYNPNANTNTAFGGILDPNVGSGAYYNGDRHLVFDAYVESKIVSSIVYAQSSNTITFELRDNNSTVIDDTTITVASGQQRLYFDFDVPVGNNYELGVSAVNSGLYRNNGGVSYPYDIGGLVSITGSNATASYYYFFYDIEVESVCTGIISPVYGCTDATACNYDALANIDDGSCILPDGCTDPLASNYDSTAVCDDGSCIPCVYGCTDATAFNYDANATCDDGTCQPITLGCTDSTAANYNPNVNTNNGVCFYYGCADTLANNYDPTNIGCDATGSTACCTYDVYGCTDPLATNYDPLATIDDNSCTYVSAGCGAITGVHMTDVIHDRAWFNWDDMNSATCVVDQIKFRYKEVGASSWNTKTMGAPVGNLPPCLNTSKRVINLIASTQYEYAFKIWYQDGTVVNWHANGTFTTADPCLNATNVTAVPLNPTKTEFCWDAPAAPWSFVRLKYKVDTAVGSGWSNIGGFGVIAPALCKTKNNLTPSQTYRVLWRTFCNPAGGPYRSPVWDGPLTWTQPAPIRVEGGTAINNLDVYPNPSRDIFNVSFTSEDIQNLEVRIINVIGEVVYTEGLNEFVGEYTKQVDLATYTKGVYLLEITTDNGIVNKKLILQ